MALFIIPLSLAAFLMALYAAYTAREKRGLWLFTAMLMGYQFIVYIFIAAGEIVVTAPLLRPAIAVSSLLWLFHAAVDSRRRR